MRVFAISDLHLSINNPKPMDIFGQAWDNYVDGLTADWQARITDDDVVVLCGDLSWAMTLEEAAPDLALIGGLSGRKVILRGNHDFWWQSITALRGALPSGMYAVQNDAVRIGDVVFFGTRGWSDSGTSEDKKIYNRELERLKLSIAAANKLKKEGDRLVCLAHYPPFDARLSSTAVTRLIAEVKPDAVIYGHLHGSACRRNLVVNKDGIPYYLTSCDIIDNKPILILD